MQNQRKEALNEKDPVRRAKILQLIEEKGKTLEEKYRKKQELSNKFNFDPSKRVNDLINSIKNALKTSNSDNGNANNNISNDGDNDNSENNHNSQKNEGDICKNFFQNNQPLIIFGVIATLLILYFYTHQEEE